MNGDGLEQGAPAWPDPRIPYAPEQELLRFEMVLARDGSLRCSFPPAHLDAAWWKLYALLADLAKQHYGYGGMKESLIARGLPPPPTRFRP